MRHRGGVSEVSTGAVSAWAGPRPARKRSVRGVSDEAFLRLLDETQKLVSSGGTGAFEGRHFVALYADLHFRVYGVAADDMGPKERVYATRLASDVLEKDFAGDREAMSRFVAWTWSRERERERWRRENGRGGGRVRWQDQFGRKYLSDFRLDQARRQGRKGP